MRIGAVLCVKDEAAFLLDWLAHHRACGVTDFVVASNDCSDGTPAMLDRLAEMGWLTHLRNDPPYSDKGVQFTALDRVARLEVIRQADWLLPLDIDEYVAVHTGDHTLPGLIAALPDATAITLTWRLFGNAGVVHYSDTPVTQQFTRAAPVVMYWPWRAAMFKTLYRNDGTYRALGVHRPRDPDPLRIIRAAWYDGEGRALSDLYRTQRLFSVYGRSNHALAQLNHYPLGAMESFIVKRARGRAVHSGDLLGMDYWTERNFNTDEDRSALVLAPQVSALRATLAEDPVLARLHDDAVAWRKARFAYLMQSDEGSRALFGRMMMTPPTQPLPERAAQFLLHHARRAQPD